MPTSENPPVQQQEHVWPQPFKSVEQQWEDVSRNRTDEVHPESINPSGPPS